VGGGVDHRHALTEPHTRTGCRSCNTSVQSVRDPEYIGKVYGMLSLVGMGADVCRYHSSSCPDVYNCYGDVCCADNAQHARQPSISVHPSLL